MWVAVRIAISLGALLLLVHFVDFHSLWTTLRGVDLRLYAGAVCCLALLMPTLGAWRWRRACAPTGTQLPYLAHLRIGLIAAFLGQALPTSVGVEATRAWLHSRRSGSLSASAAGVVADRLSGLITLLMLIVVCFPLQQAVIETDGGRALLATISAASAAGLAGLLALGLPAGGKLAALIPFARVRLFVENVRTSLTRPASAAELVGVSVLFHAASLLGIWLIAKALNVAVTPLELLVLVPPAFVVMLIPVSIAGWGLREGGFVLFLGLAGISADGALAISILFGAAMVLISLPGALLFILGRAKDGDQPRAPAAADR